MGSDFGSVQKNFKIRFNESFTYFSAVVQEHCEDG